MKIIKLLKEERGSAVLMIATVGCIVTIIFVYGITLITCSQTKSSLHSKKSAQALQIAEVGIKQIISDIHCRDVGSGIGEYTDLGPEGLASQMNDLFTTGAITRIRRDYVINNSTINVTLTLVPDLRDVDNDGITDREPEMDIENNPMYLIDSIANISDEGGKRTKKHITCQISIVNLGKFLIFNAETSPVYDERWNVVWWKENKFDGYIHSNSDLRIRGNIFVNTTYLPFKSGVYSTNYTPPSNFPQGNYYTAGNPIFVENPYYYPDYTVVVAGDIKKRHYVNNEWVLCRTQGKTGLGNAINYNPYTDEPSISPQSTDVSDCPGKLYPETTNGYTSYLTHDNLEHGQWSKICGGIGVGPPQEAERDNPWYSTVPNPTQTRGTWFDGRHGGFVIHLEPLDYSYLSSNADVIIDINDLPNFRVLGTSYNSDKLLIDLHFPSRGDPSEWAVHIDLGALGTGLDTDVCQGINNYNNALSDDYGLVIYVTGHCAVHGKLANATANNQNKKITIISTDEIDIIGDILYSDDYYMQVLDDFGTIGNWRNNIDENDARNRTGIPDWPHIEPTGNPYGLPVNDYNASYMEIQVRGTDGPPNNVIYKAEETFTIVAPHPDIDENKVYVNVREEAVISTGVDVSLILEDKFDNLIASQTITATTTWQRLVIPHLTYNDVVSLGDAGNEGNISLKFSNLDTSGNWRTFLIDELCFAVGKPYPVRVDFDNNPNPANPTEDAIILISSGDININPWYLNERLGPSQNPNPDSIKYFAINGDYSIAIGFYCALKISGLLYINTPGCGQNWYQISAAGEAGRQVEYFLFYGGIVKRRNTYAAEYLS